MSRPRRTAAEKARELIARGYGAVQIDECGAEGLSPDEEDDLDRQLDDMEACADENGNDDDDADGSAERGSSDQARNRCKTYADEDEEVNIPPFRPQRSVGPHIMQHTTRQGAAAFNRAIDFFMLFFNVELIEYLCQNSNTYAMVHILDNPSYARYIDGSWEGITFSEMCSFLGIVIYMGINVLPELSMYWSTGSPDFGHWASSVMSRNRFKAILGFLHVVDPDEENPRGKLTKIRPLLEHFKRICPSLYQPGRQVAVDERMVKSKGRSGIRQYMPKKPVRFGYKLWCLCESYTGYTLDFNVYTGKREAPSSHGLSFDVVTNLLSRYYRQGYQLWMDNFYTTTHLLRHLLEKGISACGTVQVTRRGFPSALKDKTWVKRARRGDMRYTRDGAILSLQWMDTRMVSICSTIHRGHEYNMVRRNVRDPMGNHRLIYVRKPMAIFEYNKAMGAVDLSDQLIQPYNVLLKSHRWWKTLFFHLMDVAIVNAFLLFKQWRRLHPDEPSLDRPAGYSQLAFRKELINQLVRMKGRDIPHAGTSASFSEMYHSEHMATPMQRRRNCKICYLIHGKEQKTRWACGHPNCGIALCVTPERMCMKEWHSPQFDEKRNLILETCRWK